MSRPAGSPFLASGAQPGRRVAAAGKFFYFFARNPLKSPDSTKLNQIKPSKSKPGGSEAATQPWRNCGIDGVWCTIALLYNIPLIHGTKLSERLNYTYIVLSSHCFVRLFRY